MWQIVERYENQRMVDAASSLPVALVVNGDTLETILTSNLKKDFIRLCLQCKTVLCCRVTPSQKAEVRLFPLMKDELLSCTWF